MIRLLAARRQGRYLASNIEWAGHDGTDDTILASCSIIVAMSDELTHQDLVQVIRTCSQTDDTSYFSMLVSHEYQNLMRELIRCGETHSQMNK